MNKYNRIRDLREDKDKTQKEIADILYMHLTQYRRYETGESEIPLNIALKLAEFYEVSLDYITGRTNDKTGIKSIVDQDEKKLLALYKELNLKQKQTILQLLKVMK